MSRVFLLEQPRRHIDLSTLSDYGEVVYLFGEDDRRSSVFQANQFLSDVNQKLHNENFNTATDMFCITGALLCVSQALIALTVYSGKAKLKVLVFNSKTELYEMKVIDLSKIRR